MIETDGRRPTIGKDTLFCPACGHRGTYDGEGWEIVESDDHTQFQCPECGATVTERPRARR